MAYFPNGTSGELYQAEYCEKCVHDINQDCAVWLAHLLRNYDDCNDEKSILHMLIPRAKNGTNKQCKMFYPKEKP